MQTMLLRSFYNTTNTQFRTLLSPACQDVSTNYSSHIAITQNIVPINHLQH